MMRIALVIYGDLDQISGGFVYDRALVRALAARGHEIDVLALPWHGYARAVASSIWRRGAGPSSRAAARYDVVIEDELIHPSLFARAAGTARPAARARVALVHNLRSARPGHGSRATSAVSMSMSMSATMSPAIERRYLRTVDGVIAVCARTGDDVRAVTEATPPMLIAHPGRDHVAPDADDALVVARSAQAGPLRLLHAAAITPAKGLARLLTALARAVERHGLDFTLDVAGAFASPVYARRIRRQVRRSGMQERVSLHGPLRGAALHALFRHGQVFVLPSDREAYSLACLEALGYGLPVLATAEGGLDEMISDGSEGLLMSPVDTDRWADAVAALGADRTRLRTMALAALGRYRAHATWLEVAARVEEFLRAIVATRDGETDDDV